MTMSEWAKREVEIACKKENPNWDGESFNQYLVTVDGNILIIRNRCHKIIFKTV